MSLNTKDNKLMVKKKVKELFIIPMAKDMKVNLRIIKKKEKEYFTTKIIQNHMREIGKKTKSQDLEFTVLTIKKRGMKENGKMIKDQVKENLIDLDLYMKDNSKMTYMMEREFTQMIIKGLKENGKKVKNMVIWLIIEFTIRKNMVKITNIS